MTVLILLLVEYGLWHCCLWVFADPLLCLNPSFSGIWPVALIRVGLNNRRHFVLILLLVEYGLWRVAVAT